MHYTLEYFQSKHVTPTLASSASRTRARGSAARRDHETGAVGADGGEVRQEGGYEGKLADREPQARLTGTCKYIRPLNGNTEYKCSQ